MSSAGQIIGGVVGALAGFMIAGAAGALKGASIGMSIGGVLDPPKLPTTMGPRLTDTTMQTSTYGATIPRVYGTVPVVGNIFWLENNKLKEVSKKTKVSGKGGSKQTIVTFSYFATFAVGLCQGPIAGIRRIWIGSKLLYDVGATDVSAIIASNNAASLFTLHLGDATQAADARMQATLGIANTPAYRGLAYIVLKDFPLEDYGNSLMGAQVKVEVMTGIALASGSESTSVVYTDPRTNISFPPQPRFIDAEKVVVDVTQWDNHYPATSSFLRYTFHFKGAVTTSTIVCPGTSVPPNGMYDDDQFLYSSTQVFSDANGFDGSSGLIIKRKGWFFGASKSTYLLYSSNGNPAQQVTKGWDNDVVAVASDGEYLYTISVSAVNVYDKKLNLVKTGAGYTGGGAVLVTSRANFCDGYLYLCPQFNTVSMSLIRWSLDLSTYSTVFSGVTSNIINGYYSADFSVVGNVFIAVGSEDPSTTNHKLYVFYYAFGIVSGATVPLSSIVQTECLSSGILQASDINVAALTQTFKGYKVSNIASIRSSIETLMGAYAFQIVQKGYKVYFVPRGTASVATIPATVLAAQRSGT